MGMVSALLIIVFIALLISGTAKLLLKLMNRYEVKRSKEKNPYIQYHKFKNQNDQNYDDYLKWLEKEGHGVPIDKIVSREDFEAEKKIKKML